MADLHEPLHVGLEKIVGYLLDETHPVGGPKAKFFKLFGFSEQTPAQFIAALKAHARDRLLLSTTETRHGVKSVVRCNISSPDGRNPCVDVVWINEIGVTGTRLITAMPHP